MFRSYTTEPVDRSKLVLHQCRPTAWTTQAHTTLALFVVDVSYTVRNKLYSKLCNILRIIHSPSKILHLTDSRSDEGSKTLDVSINHFISKRATSQ